jgi:hypothetical protein
MTAGSDMGSGRASSLTERPSRVPSCASRARRVGSASAAKTASREGPEHLTIWLGIDCEMVAVKRPLSPDDAHWAVSIQVDAFCRQT